MSKNTVPNPNPAGNQSEHPKVIPFRQSSSNAANGRSEYPKILPFRRPSPEEILKMLGYGDYLKEPPLRFTVISDNASGADDIFQRTILASTVLYRVSPASVQPRAISQCILDVEKIHRSAVAENNDAEATGYMLVKHFCEENPPDLILGVGEQGQALVIDLRRVVAERYPDHVRKFVTEAELSQEAAGRPFANEADAFLLVALERLHQTQSTGHSSTT